jgi:hypothetical protein
MSDIRYGSLTLSRTAPCDTYAVVYCEKTAEEVTVPAEINGVAVTEIADNAFEECRMLLHVEFEEPREELLMAGTVLTTIGEYAFSYCVNLVSIDIPYTVYSIGRGAFYNCRSLKLANLPAGAYVGSYAFYECGELESISPLSCASEGVLSSCEKLSEIELAQGISEICEDAFESCAITEIVIPKSVKRIEQLAFRGCHCLKKVIFEDPEGWYVRIRYDGSVHALDLSDTHEVAEELSRMDFDDGVDWWYKAT